MRGVSSISGGVPYRKHLLAAAVAALYMDEYGPEIESRRVNRDA